jgi:site-specific DNA-methyltransferase (adenine-specific)
MVLQGDNLKVLQTLPDAFASLIYIDPPFNTGTTQYRDRKVDTLDQNSSSYEDYYDDFIAFLLPRVKESIRCLKPKGSLFVHLDWRESAYTRVALDKLLGRDHFMNEIIWSYDYGGRSKRWWSCKHDTILWYILDSRDYTFNYNAIDRIPYMAPNLQTPERAALGKTPTDVWWHTIVPTMDTPSAKS